MTTKRMTIRWALPSALILLTSTSAAPPEGRQPVDVSKLTPDKMSLVQARGEVARLRDQYAEMTHKLARLESDLARAKAAAAQSAAAQAPGPKPQTPDAKPHAFAMKKFTLIWPAAAGDEHEICVHKTEAASFIRLQASSRSFASRFLDLSPAEAAAVASALAQTEEYWARMKSSEFEVLHPLDAGGHKVTFNYDPKSGFRVRVAPAQQSFGDTLFLTREDAKALAPVLAQGKELVAYLDSCLQVP